MKTGKPVGRAKGSKNRPKGQGAWFQNHWFPNLELLPAELRTMPTTILSLEDVRLNRDMPSKYKDPIFKKKGPRSAYQRHGRAYLDQTSRRPPTADTTV